MPLAPGSFLFEPFAHTRGLGEKDLTLALALGESMGVELPLAEIALRRLADGLGVPHRAPSDADEPAPAATMKE